MSVIWKFDCSFNKVTLGCERRVHHFCALQIGVSLDETVDEEDINDLLYIFRVSKTAVSQSLSSSISYFFYLYYYMIEPATIA